MTRIVVIALILGLAVRGVAQSDITTFIFVRHAEKVNDGSKDPELSEAGKQRAIKLSQTLLREPVSAIYSTDFKRTRGTISPLADALGMRYNIYESMTSGQLRDLSQKHKGGTVVICGHSNTTPAMVNLLTGSETLKQFDDRDYGNLIIVSVTGGGEAKVTRLIY